MTDMKMARVYKGQNGVNITTKIEIYPSVSVYNKIIMQSKKIFLQYEIKQILINI